MWPPHAFDQNLWQQLCLVYTRAATADLLALTDLDERPPAGLEEVLPISSTTTPLGAPVVKAEAFVEAGVRLFFDSMHTCGGRCPCGGLAAWRRLCAHRGRAMDGKGRPRRWSWKPIVVPRMVHDVGTHGFATGEGAGRLSNIFRGEADETSWWCPCLQHV